MRGAQWCVGVAVLLLLLPPRSWESRSGNTITPSHSQNRWWVSRAGQGWPLVSTVKRHSEGTFTSDFTHYLDNIKARDFVHWLISTRRQSQQRRQLQGGGRERGTQQDHPVLRYEARPL